jgi:hypothetical protein
MRAILSSLPSLVLTLGLATTLAGCAGDGIELNGKIFDAMGISQSSSSTAEPVVAQRAGIVIPPKQAALPVPGSGSDVTASLQAQLPNDPTQLVTQKAAADEAARQKKCREERNNPRAADDTGESACDSLLKTLTGKSLNETITGAAQ